MDVFVLGAGVAGLCAAIRLLDMGYKVGMLEQEEFPRPQIGESLSPGIYNIFDFLKLSHLLEDAMYLKQISAKVIWENKEEIYHRNGSKNGGLVVDRSTLDLELLKFAKTQGLLVFQPAKLLDQSYADKEWTITISEQSNEIKVKTKIVLDARGRKGTLLNDRVAVAPTTVAVWTHINNHSLCKEALIEAVEDAWLWGSPVSQNRYRIMAFTDPITIKKNKAVHLLDYVSKTTLFSQFKNKIKNGLIETCTVNSYVNKDPWNNQWIKLGEAAFTLDPLSSTGVEKAMRFSLQVAIAVNSYLKDMNSIHSKDFYEEKLIESSVSHAQWTKEYYQDAWANSEPTEFWKKRADFKLDVTKYKTEFTSKLKDEFNKERIAIEEKHSEAIPVDYILNKLWNECLNVSPQISYKTVYAINNDFIEIKQAINHPNLHRPMVYLDQVELNPVFKNIKGNKVSDAVVNLNHIMPLDKAKKIVVFLLQKQLLIVN